MTPSNPQEPAGGRFARFLQPALALAARFQLLTLAMTVVVVFGALGAFALYYLRGQALAEGERLTASYAHIIEEQTTRTLQAVDLRMSMVVDELNHMAKSGQLDATTGHELMKDYVKGLPFVRSLWVLDAQGRIVYDSDTGNIGLNLSDRDYFKIYLTQPATTRHIGTPVRSRVNGKWLIAMTQVLRNETGQFNGILVAALETAHFNNLWHDVELGAGGAIGLFKLDGTMMLRNPPDDTAVGRRFPELPVFSALRQSANGLFSNVSPFDGGQRMYAYRTLTAFPGMVIVVGQSVNRVLAAWSTFAMLAFAIWLLGSLAIIGLSVVLGHTQDQKDQAHALGEKLTQRLTLATDAAGISVWEWDLIADTWTVTPTFFTMLGRDPAEGQDKPVSWLYGVHPDDRGLVAKRSNDLRFGTATELAYEARWQHAAGSYRWIRVIARELDHGPDGRPSRLLGVMMDVTDLRRAEQERQQVVERITDAFVALDKTGRFTFANARAGQIFNQDHRAMVGRHVWEVFPKGSGMHFADAYSRAMKIQEPAYVEEYFEPVQRWLGSHIYPSPDGMTIYGQDITARKQAEAALKESEERYRVLVDMSPYAIAVHQDEKIVFANRMTLTLYGASSPDQLIGRDLKDLLPAERLVPMRERLKKMLAGDTSVYPVETIYTRIDGSDIEVEASGAPCTFNGRPAIQFVTMDITERNRARAALNSSLREKEFLLREVHHRVKNNLQVITSLLRLESARSADPHCRVVLVDMQSRIRTMSLLHESLYRGDTFAEVRLDAYLKELASQAFRAAAPQGRDIRLKLDLEPVHIGMEQAAPCGLLVNELISNSLKHGFPPGQSGEVRVILSATDNPRHLRLQVSDTGVGLPPDFETRQKTSLGLQLVSDLAKQLGGSLSAGPGPEVVFTLDFTATARHSTTGAHNTVART